MRAWGLGFGLRAAGFRDVAMAFAADSVRGKNVDPSIVPGVAMFERSQLDDFIAEQAPDAVVFQHWPLLREVKREPDCPIAIDLAGPHLLERRLWKSPDPEVDLREKLEALARADHVVCSGKFQRHYFLPFLVQAGHDARQTLCPVIPFSLSPDMPEPDPEREHDTFVYTGMFLPWQDPEATLRAVVEELEEKDRGKLLFVGGPHPSGDVSGGQFDQLMQFLEKSERVEHHPVMPFDELLGRLRKAGTAVDLMPRNAERELAFPTRTVTYMWAGLPVIHNDYDELAQPISRAKAGWTFDAVAQQDEVRKIVRRLLSHREDVERRGANARDLVRKRYTWDQTIGPLASWCEDPRPRAEKRAPVIAAPATGKASPPRAASSRKRDTISYSPPASVTDTSRGPWYLSPIVFLLALPISAVLVFLLGLAEIARQVTRRG